MFVRTIFLIAHIHIRLSAATPVEAQLPSEILGDCYLLQVKQAVLDGDPERAWGTIQEVIVLGRDHNPELPEFHPDPPEGRETMNTPMTAFTRHSAVPCGNRLDAR